MILGNAEQETEEHCPFWLFEPLQLTENFLSFLTFVAWQNSLNFHYLRTCISSPAHCKGQGLSYTLHHLASELHPPRNPVEKWHHLCYINTQRRCYSTILFTKIGDIIIPGPPMIPYLKDSEHCNYSK